MFLRAHNASQRNHSVFDADQIRPFAKMLSGRVRRGSSVVLHPAASQDRCQGGMQDLEELRSPVTSNSIIIELLVAKRSARYDKGR
jgi:hypothetical protein